MHVMMLLEFCILLPCLETATTFFYRFFQDKLIGNGYEMTVVKE
jgi:hypothetical protein